MIRLTAILSAVIFAAMAITSEDDPKAVASQPAVDSVKPVKLASADTTTVEKLSVNPFTNEATPTKTDVLVELPISNISLTDTVEVGATTVLDTGFASINAADLTANGEITQIALDDPITSSFSTIIEEAALPMMQVSGNRVNVRSGPSTQNPVMGRLVKNDSAELVEAMDNGWSKIRFGESSRIGFMASKFLTATP